LKEFELRDYQTESIEKLRQGIREGHRSQILCSPTGSGKTVIAAYLMSEADKKYSRVGFVVDRVNLVDQASAVLDEYGIEHGVIQAGHWRRRPHERLQVCSAQTLEKRGSFPGLNLLIVDEAHCVRKQTAELIKNMQDVRVLGLSATPFTKGLGQLYTNIVNVTTTDKLVAEGHLVPLKMYAAKAIDMAGAKVVAGEWADREIEERGMKIVGDIVGEWVDKTTKHYGGPVKTIVFSATVDHGEELCRQFNDAGFNFQQISYRDKNDDKRRELITEFRKPDSEIHGLVSCEVFTKGFDVPDILCGISARPYRKSFSSHIQQLGRVMRPFPGKKDALWLCHSGNLIGFADEMFDLFANGVRGIEEGKRDQKVRKEPTPREKEMFSCSCGYILAAGVMRCPACGKEKTRIALVENVEGEMVALSHTEPKLAPYLADKEAVWRQLCHHALERKGGDEISAERFAKAQYRNLYGTWPRHAMRNIEPEPAHPLLLRKVQQQIIKWAKRKQMEPA
jgi:DNA repair protein RadD